MWLEKLYDAVWGVPVMGLILGTGLLLSILCRWPQFTRFGQMLRAAFGGISGKTKHEGGVSPFQAMCTALAASLGTGNIAGVAGAIALGGPGAVFWMWVSAILGMCTKFVEVTLAVEFRERGPTGEWLGGPMYYIKNGLGKQWSWLAAIFALFGALASFGIGNMAQVNTISAAVRDAVGLFYALTPDAERLLALLVGAACAAAAFAALTGGVKRIGDICTCIIPPLALLYTAASLVVIFCHIGDVPAAFAAILEGAFHPQALLGGGAGITLRSAIAQGVGRGVFSNEAGLGSAPIAHASADVAHPARQGLFGMLEVFVDTIIVCTMTALVILLGVDPIPYGRAAGAELAVEGFASVFGGVLPSIIVAGCLALFALPTILTWGLYGSRCVEFLWGGKAAGIYRAIFALCALMGGVLRLDAVWLASGILNGLMAAPNLAALVALAPTAARLSKQDRHPLKT